ncbi:hypothetical protein UCRPA7_6298 [Phaeoacremonium minimum UCRPA7]|uniref:Uncharacterized protein n=1 Tax=Phaeoacremonium minimum (strain UCR-PA7) TaxID=1286976 RepID=R8BFU3_PHAM7|nr:hypothetical protein UCRPA7_6298 [Phaeoacremonium minimum UCRPA7]EON98181.1 hypothetical protein UCRPA7_6298 [Phaeoacremonium minimum UCRPA7]
MAAAAAPAGVARFKRFIWTGAFAAVTVVGSIYGAGLKTQQEFKAERRKIIEASPEEKIAMMEERRKRLLMQRRPFEKKLEEVQGRIKAREEEAATKANGK